LSKIDEVGAMGQYMSIGFVSMLYGKSFELIPSLEIQWWISPFPLGFKEESKSIGADVKGIVNGFVDSCEDQSRQIL